MLAIGQPTHLPATLAANPFYRLIVKFSRYKTGSLEVLFEIEAILLQYAWAAVIIMMALVALHVGDIDYLSSLVRLTTVVYPFFFIWSITRISGVELLQLVLEGHWTGEVLATPLDNRDLTEGFITPMRLTFQRYWLIAAFSLAFYCLATSVIVFDENHHLILDIQDLINRTWFSESFFFSAIAWIVFVYLTRLFGEARLRNGLLKGLTTAALFILGLVVFGCYWLLLFVYPGYITDHRVLWAITALTALLSLGSWFIRRLLERHFHRYLQGQLGIDLLIYDNLDLHSTAWAKENS